MVRVMASGAFDIIHPGHIYYLRRARALGDELYVVVASDATVERRKRRTVMDQRARVAVVEALKPVDVAVPGGDGDIYETLDTVRPDVIALGHDQDFDEDELVRQCRVRGLRVRVERIPPLDGELNASSGIIRRIATAHREAGK